jgi:mRNA interferase MazF
LHTMPNEKWRRMMNNHVCRGQIWMVDWSPGRGSEQTGVRPAIVIQTDAANLNPHYPNTIVVAVSTKGKSVPFHVLVNPSKSNGLKEISFVKCEQVFTISKDRLIRLLGKLEEKYQDAVAQSLRIVLNP